MARHVVDPTSMHRYTDETERVARAALGYARDRMRLHPGRSTVRARQRS